MLQCEIVCNRCAVRSPYIKIRKCSFFRRSLCCASWTVNVLCLLKNMYFYILKRVKALIWDFLKVLFKKTSSATLSPGKNAVFKKKCHFYNTFYNTCISIKIFIIVICRDLRVAVSCVLPLVPSRPGESSPAGSGLRMWCQAGQWATCCIFLLEVVFFA